MAVATLLASWPFGGALAQDLEPRLYTNVPVGMNFLGAGYAYSEGNVLSANDSGQPYKHLLG